MLIRLLFACCVILHAILSSAAFFNVNVFKKKKKKKKKKNTFGTLSECQTVWIQIRTDILSGLIWVQTVCKGYQQMTKVAIS